MLLPILFFVLIFICLAMLWNEGMWGNAITFVNVVLAAIVATNCFEPLANYFEEQASSFTYVVDFLSIWAIFWLSFSVFRAVTDAISKHEVRFRMPVEFTGRVLFAAATAWVLICFSCMTLHMAPLARTAFRGSFQAEPMSNNFVGLAPDRMWLGFVHSRSQGALATGEPRVFDPTGEYILKYGSRRQDLQKYNALEGSIRIKK